jgi:leucyl/phenylalanyl-tRNA--protein transferase
MVNKSDTQKNQNNQNQDIPNQKNQSQKNQKSPNQSQKNVSRNAVARIRFPDPRATGSDGLLHVGGALTVDNLVEAYRSGIFPWPQEGLPILWFSPVKRGVLDFSEVHWPRSFLREVRANDAKRRCLDPSHLNVTFDQDFRSVIEACATVPRKIQDSNVAAGTWILSEMQEAYLQMYLAGFAHSVECWRGGELVGGLYGVYVDGVFSGESMFHRLSGASKICLYYLIEQLRSMGMSWIDIQMVTPVLETFGGKYISRDEFLARVDVEHKRGPSYPVWRRVTS